MPKNSVPRLIYASSMDSADMLYAVKFFVPDPFIFLEQNGKRTIVLGNLEIDRARKEAAVDEIVSLAELEKPFEDGAGRKPPIEPVMVAFLRKRKIKKVAVPRDFPYGVAKILAENGISLIPLEDPFWSQRELKDSTDLKHLQTAIKITEIGLARAIEVLKASQIKPKRKLVWGGKTLTSEILRAEIDIAIIRAGGLAMDTIVAGGDQACDPHDLGSGPLAANSLIILDLFPRHTATGFHGDLTRTVVRGKANDAQRRLWDTVLEGQEFALKNIAPGKDGKLLQDSISNLFATKGYPTEIKDGRWTGFFHGLGHGLGLEVHETPRISQTRFKPGQFLTVEPGIYVPGIGGARHEDDGVVTDKGFRVLSKFPKQLEI